MKVTDEQIREVMVALRGQGAKVTGARVRRELAARHGARGGVAHIYRVLREAPVAAPEDVAALEAELTAARERAVRAEAREDAHQLMWAREVDTLRQRVKELEHAQTEAVRWQDAYQRLAIELQSAQVRAAEMERRLVELEG